LEQGVFKQGGKTTGNRKWLERLRGAGGIEWDIPDKKGRKIHGHL